MITDKKMLPRFIQPRINSLMSHVVENIYGRDLIVGKYPESDDIVLQSNDYLCLANHPYVRSRIKAALERHDESIFMSSIYLHDDELKPSVEKRFTDFVHFDNCLISQSGWSANAALLQTICTPESNVYIDFFAHMSMWEGARYANAKIRPFMHNNCDHLRKLIQRNGPGVIVVDSLYSTIGTIAPLVEIVAIAKEFDCATVIDESHSLGVYGTNGAGLLEELGLSKEVDFMTASLAKSFAYRAGAIWTNNDFGQCIPYTGFPNIFSSTIMPYELDALEATLDVIQTSDDRRNNLFKQTKNLRIGLHDIGVPIRSQSQIVALETGNEINTKNVRIYLENRGIIGAVFCPPATAKNSNIIRLSMHSSIREEQVEYIISVLYDVMKNEELFIL